MKVDLYKRPETAGKFSYLAVPEGKPIPEEATNLEWEKVDQIVDFEGIKEPVHGLKPDDVLQQISDKGYAISHLKDQVAE
ncbi:MAG: hypothetical protein H7315_09140 [Herminiimonas sp.]|nr:hypothetical protein [Herminiimonas sp.]